MYLKEFSIPATEKIKGRIVSAKFNTETIKLACVDLIAHENCPFNLINSRAFRRIMDPIQSNAVGFEINSDTVRQMIYEKSDEIVAAIKSELRNRLFSLKLDAVTRLNRSVVGITIQYISNGRIETKTLAVIEVNEKQTPQMIKSFMTDTLEQFDLKSDQIYSITTDNGRNMLKAISLLNESLGCEEMEYEEMENVEMENDQMGNEEMNNLEWDNELEVLQTLNSRRSDYLISSIKCAAHTLQLVVYDLHKDSTLELECMITTLRNAALKLRTPTQQTLLLWKCLRPPILSVPTRWNSVYDMVEQMVELKDHCDAEKESHCELNISDERWDAANEYIKVLAPVKALTLRLQSEQPSAGDFYKWWSVLKMKCSNYTSRIALRLRFHVENREVNTLKNTSLLSALYLDPRFNFTLSYDEIQTATNHLKKLFLHWQSIQPNTATVPTQPAVVNFIKKENSSDEYDIFDESVELDEYFTDSYSIPIQSQSIENVNLQIFKSIETFRPPRMSMEINIYEFWQLQKKNNKELAILAEVVHAIPSAQLSIERCLSSLKLLLMEQRNSLDHDTINKKLLIKNNYKFDYDNIEPLVV